MQLNITGQNVDITPALKAHTARKFEKINRHFEFVLDVSVVLKIEKNRQIAEARLHLAGNDLFAESQGTDMYGSIESVVSKLDSQVIKHKQKQRNHRN